MKFVCGACGGTIKKVNSPKHHASFVPHEGETGCGYETFFATHVVTPTKPSPLPVKVRRIGEEGEGIFVKDFVKVPSADDLDAAAAEKKLKENADDEADALKKISESGEDKDGDPGQEAIDYLISTGKSQEEAEKLVDRVGVEKILKSKANAEAKAAKKSEKEAKEAAKAAR